MTNELNPASPVSAAPPAPTSGTRGRIVAPSPPAPVPAKRPEPAPAEATALATEDRSTLRREGTEAPRHGESAGAGKAGETDAASDGSVVRATGSMAVATLISRITGFLRNVLIGSSLGPAISSAFITANQLPNLITEIVLGAVLTSLVVPVLVRAEAEDADRGEAFVRRLFTLAFSLLAVITVLSCLFAPQITTMMLTADGKVNDTQATSFAYLLLPQIFFYGLFALFQAVLNTKNIFGPGAWAPVLNNVISIAVLVSYQLVPGRLHPDAPSPVHDPHVLLLGLGTTAGVVVQALILFPYLKRAGINLRPLWGIDDRLKQFGGMALAIVAYVAISQLGYVITTRVASQADEGAPITYQQAWLLLQVPYGIIGVTLLTAIMPRLSRNAAQGDDQAVVRDLTLGTKLTFIALIPIVIFLTGFGVPIARGLFQYGAFGAESAGILGLTLSFSAFTLIPYALVLLHLRVFYAREEAWTPTFIIAGITLTKVVLSLLAPAVADSPERVVILLGTANGFGFIAGAVIGGFLLKRKLGSLGGPAVLATTGWAIAASIVGLVAASLVDWGVSFLLPERIPAPIELVRLLIVGLVFVGMAGVVLSRSGLPEVVNLGRQLQRIPGLSRFIKLEGADAIEVEAPQMQEISPMLGQDVFNASPVPPPMSAGIVRGPRLVPGAPVSDGRFRLLQDCGSVPGARFWQAREQGTGRLVALTFVDTTGEAPMAPVAPAVAARRSAAVSRRTRKLAELELGSVAPNVDILSYRSGCLIVADWVDGSPLKVVASAGDLDARAVAGALAPLVADAATAHEEGLVFGLDNRDRIRISTAGRAVLAFPAVLENNSEDKDAAAIGSAIGVLVGATDPTPTSLRAIAKDASAENEATAGVTPLREIATRLQEVAGPQDASDGARAEALPVASGHPEIAEDPEARAGFGSRGYSRSGIALLGVFAIVFVVAMAALTTWIMSLVGDREQGAPVTSDSIKQQTSVPQAPPILLRETSAISVPDGKEHAELISEDNDAPWTSTQEHAGLLVTVDEPTQLNVLQVVHSQSAGAAFRVYGVRADSFDPHNPRPEELVALAKGKLEGTRNDIDLKPLPDAFDAVFIEFSTLPAAGEVRVFELQLAGQA